jgi:hypothetical protein
MSDLVERHEDLIRNINWKINIEDVCCCRKIFVANGDGRQMRHRYVTITYINAHVFVNIIVNRVFKWFSQVDLFLLI